MMKRILFVIAMTLPMAAVAQDLTTTQQAAMDAATTIAQAQPEAVKPEKISYWTNSIGFDLGMNQTALVNWAAGGYNTVNLGAGIDAKADYEKGLTRWNNRLQLNYGFMWSQDKANLLQKSNDRIYLESKWAYKTSENSKWNYTAAFDFRSQFSNTFDNYKQVDPENPKSKWNGDLKSGFLSPAYTNIALGMEWKPAKWFDLNISPVTGGFTIVTNPALRHSYGMKKFTDDEILLGNGLGYKPALFQFGAQLKANFSVNINDNFKFDSQFVYFTDYLDGPFYKSYRINWDNGISWQPAKFFKIALNTWLIYDTNVLIKNEKDIEKYPNGRNRVQFKEFLSLNFTYSIATKKDK